MYHEYFGLNQAPFKITPDTRLFFTGGSRGDVLHALVYAIMTGEGIVKVVGEVGSGKTMLCRMLAVKLPASVEIIFIANPSLSPDDILHAIALEMKLPIKADAKRLEVVDALQRRLLEKHEQNRRVVVFVEEAQSMSIATLEEIRLLSNLETEHDKLLQMTLFGQPELNRNLNSPNIRQLKERITHSFYLSPFDRDDVTNYIDFRLRATGYRGPDIFSKAACRRLWSASAGLVRRVNILADKSMLAAYAGNTHRVTRHHVATAIRDSEFRPVSRIAPSAYVAVGLSIGAVVGLTIVYPDRVPWQVSDTLSAILGPAATERVPSEVAGRGEGPGVPSQALAITDRGGATLAVVPAPSKSVGNGESGPSLDAVASSRAQPRDADQPAVTVASGAVVGPALKAEAAEERHDSGRQIEEAMVDPSSPGVAAPHSLSLTDMTRDFDAALGAHALGPDEESLSSQQVARSPVEAVERAAGTEVEEVHRLVAVESEEFAPPTDSSNEAIVSVEHKEAADIVTRRLNATRQWLGRVDSRHYSIQLLVTEENRRENLALFLVESQTTVELGKLYVYKTQMRGGVWFSVLYNEYETFNDARKALDRLPNSLKQSGPFVRRIRGIEALG